MRAGLQQALLLAAAAGLSSAAGAAELLHPAGGLASPLAAANGTARGAALGNAVAGLGDDASALLLNPAGLGPLDRVEYSFTHNAWLQDSSQELGLAAAPLGPGVLGLSASYFNFGSFEGRSAEGLRQGSFGASRLDLGGAWAQAAGGAGRLWWGLGGRLSLSNFADQSYAAGAIDAGLLGEPLPGLRLGAALQNLGTSLGLKSQATDLQLGASWALPWGEEGLCTLALGSSLEPGGVNRLMAGADLQLMRRFALRAGYQLPLNIERAQGLTGLTAGFGVQLPGLQLDYAFVPCGEIGTTHRFSLGGRFGAARGAEPAAAPAVQVQATPAPTPEPTPEPTPAAPAPKPKPKRRPTPQPSPGPSPNPGAAAGSAEPAR